MVSAVKCAKRARAPTSPAASDGEMMQSGAASPGHHLPCPGGFNLPPNTLKGQYRSLERLVLIPSACRLLLERAHRNPPAPSLHHQGIARLPMAPKQLGAAGCMITEARCKQCHRSPAPGTCHGGHVLRVPVLQGIRGLQRCLRPAQQVICNEFSFVSV